MVVIPNSWYAVVDLPIEVLVIEFVKGLELCNVTREALTPTMLERLYNVPRQASLYLGRQQLCYAKWEGRYLEILSVPTTKMSRSQDIAHRLVSSTFCQEYVSAIATTLPHLKNGVFRAIAVVQGVTLTKHGSVGCTESTSSCPASL